MKAFLLIMTAWLLSAAVARQELVNLEKENARAIKLHNPTFFKSAYSEDFHRFSRYGEVAKKNRSGLRSRIDSVQIRFPG